jgi:uncharacterized membrane protein (UPF0127 family)
MWYNDQEQIADAIGVIVSPGGPVLVNQTTGETLASSVRLCNTFWSRLRGLMFRPLLRPDEVYLFCYERESITETSIHMFFVSFPIAVLWLDAGYQVVDKVLAKPWRPYYASGEPAQFFVEGVPALLGQAQVGDVLRFEEGTG